MSILPYDDSPSRHLLLLAGRVAGLEEWTTLVKALHLLRAEGSEQIDPLGAPSGNDCLDDIYPCTGGAKAEAALARLATLPRLAFAWFEPAQHTGRNGRIWPLDRGQTRAVSFKDTAVAELHGEGLLFGWRPRGDTGPLGDQAPQTVRDALVRDGAFVEQDGMVWCADCGHDCGSCGPGRGLPLAQWMAAAPGVSAHDALAALTALKT